MFVFVTFDGWFGHFFLQINLSLFYSRKYFFKEAVYISTIAMIYTIKRMLSYLKAEQWLTM